MDEKKSRSKKENNGFEIILEKILPNLNESDFLLFYNLGAGEENLKKWLEKNATLRKRNMSWIASEWAKKSELPENIAKKILLRYQNAEKLRDTGDSNPLLGHAISATMEHISILHKNGENIDDSIIAQFSHEFSGDKIFSFVDAILAENMVRALDLRKKIGDHLWNPNEINSLLSSLIWILRKNLYILTLRDLGATQSQIIEKLPWISSFMVEKALKSPIKSEKFWKFFQKIENINIAYRSGKWMKKNVLWQLLEIDTAILSLKK